MVKMSFLSKLIHKFKTIQIKTPIRFFIELDKPILKFIPKCKGPRLANIILTKNKVEELTLPDFKTYHKATGVKTM